MKKLTYNQALLFITLGMIKNLCIGACIWGTIIYFALLVLSYDIPFSRCFVSVVLLRSLYMGIMSYIQRDEIAKAVEKAINEYNKQV